MAAAWTDSKTNGMIELEYNSLKITLEPGERATGRLALAMLVQSGLLPELSASPVEKEIPIASPVIPSLKSPPPSPLSPTTPTSPRGTSDLQVLDHGCALGSCTHILAAIYQARLLQVPNGGRLYLTANETPADFRHPQSRGLRQKIQMYDWDNVRLMQGEMKTLPFVGPHFTHIFSNLSTLFCASDDEPIHEMYRCLLPNGIVGFSSWKSLGWTYDVGHDPGAAGDPLMVFPSNGWRDPEYIRKKLAKHGFDSIQITELSFENKASPEVFASVADRLVRHAVSRLWSHENNDASVGMTEDDIELIAQSVIDQHQGRLFTGQMVAWITTARKPPLGQ
ncbi:hypothetical protein P389DRAFT_109160 [Cystobasidium minutum MCA 4210]|uniref:uncharacterized protein n=1 Tax=Cystobasidium minutum MCA 4210 TaxID=1397322 RepID=UPI0034CFED24|eukprot:jgi/Rhomi1/109160/CE109159_1747